MRFEVSIGNLINIIMISVGIGISWLSIVQISKAPIEKRIRRFFHLFLSTVIIYITMHLARELIEGNPGITVRRTIQAVTFFEFLASGFMSFMLTLMILSIAYREKIPKVWKNSLLVMLSVHCLLLIISQPTRLYYYFDEANIYHRSKLYLLSNIIPLILLIMGIYLLVKRRDQFSRRLAYAFWIYLLAPVVALVVQAFYSKIQFVIFATVAAAANMFAAVTDELTEKFEQQQVEASRLETELSMATRIQADMLPNIFPAFPERREFDVYATMSPAKEVGGDFYDFFLIDEDHLGIVMADVSGKGVPAALFMMASKIIIQNFTMIHKSPKEALEAANRQICGNNLEDMFVTVWLGIVEISTGILTAANAGHEYPVFKHPDGRFELYKDKHGFVIGGYPGVKYKEYTVQLEKGAILFVYTDGVAEATNANNELFGTERLIETLNNAKEDAPRCILGTVRNAVDTFVNGAPQFDDLTMLCFKYNGID